jgi:hypothetical protein
MKLESLSPAQKAVFDEAKAQMRPHAWYTGVCIDNFPSNSECVNNFKEAVDSVVANTALWDAPSPYSDTDIC